MRHNCCNHFLSLWVVLLLSTFFIAACDSQSSHIDDAASLMLKPCPGFSETGHPPLVDGAECGQLWVHENPDDSKSQKISLQILRLPAISPVAEKDPLFLIQGGPGGSSVDMAEQIHAVFWDVRKNRDLIFVDQRGTGQSNPLKCETLSADQMKLPEAEQERILDAIYQSCAKKYASNAAFYTTPYAVNDLDKVRAALGYERINLWGGSYGTRVALEYARVYPDYLRSMVLDGVAPVSMSLPQFVARDAGMSLKKIDENCHLDNACAERYAPILKKADQLLERLRESEAKNIPFTIDYLHPRYQKKMTLTLSVETFSNLIFSSLYSRELSALLPQVIHDAAQGQYQALATLYFLAEENMKKMSISDAMRYSVICSEDYQFATDQQPTENNQFLGYDVTADIKNICSIWPKKTLPEEYFTPVKSKVPALLLSGGLDPVTPSRWAETVATHLPNAQSLIVKGGHHIVSYQGCVPQLIAEFIEQASGAGMSTECVDKINILSPDLGAYDVQIPMQDEESRL